MTKLSTFKGDILITCYKSILLRNCLPLSRCSLDEKLETKARRNIPIFTFQISRLEDAASSQQNPRQPVFHRLLKNPCYRSPPGLGQR